LLVPVIIEVHRGSGIKSLRQSEHTLHATENRWPCGLLVRGSSLAPEHESLTRKVNRFSFITSLEPFACHHVVVGIVAPPSAMPFGGGQFAPHDSFDLSESHRKPLMMLCQQELA